MLDGGRAAPPPGSFAARLGADGRLLRAGGRGGLIDDAGSGPWIAREALKAVWRAEDVAPGAWRGSPLARALFERIGGSDWDATRAWVYGGARARGELGTLAVAVADAAAQDPDARRLLERAGAELARLVNVYENPAVTRYVHLTDGGIADNLALRGLLNVFISLTPEDAFYRAAAMRTSPSGSARAASMAAMASRLG